MTLLPGPHSQRKILMQVLHLLQLPPHQLLLPRLDKTCSLLDNPALLLPTLTAAPPTRQLVREAYPPTLRTPRCPQDTTLTPDTAIHLSHSLVLIQDNIRLPQQASTAPTPLIHLRLAAIPPMVSNLLPGHPHSQGSLGRSSSSISSNNNNLPGKNIDRWPC